MKARYYTLIIVWLLIACLFNDVKAGTEAVTLVKVFENDDKVIIERKNGEQWVIEKGIGTLSFWRFEGKEILIHSPGLFCGIGSKVILPDVDQQAKIWNAEMISSGSYKFAEETSSPGVTDAELTVVALSLLGYFDPESIDSSMSDITRALITFQEDHELKTDKELGFNTQITLAREIANLKPSTEESTTLALELMKSAQRLLGGTSGSAVDMNSRNSTLHQKNDLIESQIDGDFEGWEGETIVKLMNGQIWQQSEYYYHYHYAFMPEVLIYKSGGFWKMRVEGVDKAVGVTRLK
jgi:hypothetical protein